LQQRALGYVLDDLVVHGERGPLSTQFQVKRSVTITPSDVEFVDVVGQALQVLSDHIDEVAGGELALGLIAEGDVRAVAELSGLTEEWAHQHAQYQTFTAPFVGTEIEELVAALRRLGARRSLLGPRGRVLAEEAIAADQPGLIVDRLDLLRSLGAAASRSPDEATRRLAVRLRMCLADATGERIGLLRTVRQDPWPIVEWVHARFGRYFPLSGDGASDEEDYLGAIEYASAKEMFDAARRGAHGQLPLAHLVFGPAGLRGGVGLELLELVRGGAPGRLEVSGVPAGEAGTGLVRALAEREQWCVGVACGAHRLVGEDRQ
jgi:hypothetical protein